MNNSKENKNRRQINIKETLLGGEGISDVEERRQKFVEKHSVKHEVNEQEKEAIKQQINQVLVLKINSRDFLAFFLTQFLPLIAIGSGMLIPGIIKLSSDLYFIILIVFGGLALLFVSIRFLMMLSFKVQFTNDKIRWRSLFWWNEIPNKDITEINAIQGYFMYFTKIGGVGRIGVEAIQIKAAEKEYWVRAYPLKKNRGDYLVVLVKCWSEIECPQPS